MYVCMYVQLYSYVWLWVDHAYVYAYVCVHIGAETNFRGYAGVCDHISLVPEPLILPWRFVWI